MNRTPVLISNVVSSLKNVLNSATKEYIDGFRGGNVEVILTREKSFGEKTEFIFVAFHPSYVELCYRNRNEHGSFGTNICTFMTNECSVESIAMASAVIIENHYKY